MEAQRRRLGGSTVRWLEHGTGRPVVLLHGMPTSPRLWRHVMPLVEGRSLAWEMPGYGTSIPEGRGRDLSLRAQAGYLLEWLDGLRLDEKPLLVGHDLGGGVAQIAATRSPARFAGLVLTNAVSYDSWPIPLAKAMQPLAPALAHLPEMLVYPAIAQLIHRGHDDHDMALESLGEHWAPYVTHGAARAMTAQVRALDVRDTADIAHRLPRLGLPARVVWGEADRFQKLSYGERLASDLSAGLTRIAGGKHFTPEDHPDVVAGAVNDLLGRVPAR